MLNVVKKYVFSFLLIHFFNMHYIVASEGRSVPITQPDSIDPILFVYRAKATFVGVNLWDSHAAVVTSGVRRKQHENGVLSKLTELGHMHYRRNRSG